jgi:hypothetical protein
VVEKDLAKWIGKVNQILSNLPASIRQPLLDSFASADYRGKDNPLSPLVVVDAMRKILERSITDDQAAVRIAILQDDSLADADPDDYFEPDIAKIPDNLASKKAYSDQIHRQVAKLVSVLSHAETDKMHILKAYKFFAKGQGRQQEDRSRVWDQVSKAPRDSPRE